MSSSGTGGGNAFHLHSLIYGSPSGAGGGAAGGRGEPQPRRKRKRQNVKEDDDESESSSSDSDSSYSYSPSQQEEGEKGGSTKKKDSSQVEKDENAVAAAALVTASNSSTAAQQLLHVVDRSSNFLRTVYYYGGGSNVNGTSTSSEANDKKKMVMNSNNNTTTTTNVEGKEDDEVEEDDDVMPHQVTSQQSQSHSHANDNNDNAMAMTANATISLQPSILVRKPKRKKKRYAMIKNGKVVSNINTAINRSYGVGGRAKVENLLHPNSKEYKIREARVARQQEWACSIRSKWKNRKYDLRQEPDIGNAIEHVVQKTQERNRQLKPYIEKNEKNDSDSSSSSDWSSSDESSSDDDDDDNEQTNILKRLLRHSQEEVVEASGGDNKQKKKKKRKRKRSTTTGEADDDSDNDSDNDSVFIPYSDKLNYWELGRHQPRSNQIDVKYNVDTVTDVIPGFGLQTSAGAGAVVAGGKAGFNNKKSTKRPHYRYRYNQKLKLCPSGLVTFFNDNDDYNITGEGGCNHNGNGNYGTALGKRSTYHRQLVAESYQRNYVLGQSQTNHSIYTKPKFVHQRQLLRLASRHLIVNNSNMDTDEASTTSATTNVIDHVLLQSLWDTDLIQDSNRSHLVMTQANLYGRFLDFYLRHKWTSSSDTEGDAAAEVDVDNNNNEVNGGKKKKGRQQRAATTVAVAASGFAGNKEEVAEALGIAYSEYGVPPSWSGWTTYPKTLYEYWRESEHPKLLSKYRPTPVPWSSNTAAAAAAASSETNNNSYKRQLFIHPNIYYVPVPGAVPPTITECSPPLDITNVVFGPFDKYHYVFHKSDKVNHASYALTMSFLLSKKCSTAAAAANFEFENFNDVEQQQQQWDTAMTTITERCANQLTANKLYKRLKNYSKSNVINNECSMIEELPLSAYAKSVRAYCSLLATTATPNKSASSGGDTSSGGAVFAPTADDTAAIKFDFDSLDVEKWVEHNGLNLFSSLHVTFGLFHISRSLPTNSCVELLSRPLILSGGYCGGDNRNNNNNSSGTIEEVPMERIKQLLEYMENEHLLIDNINHNTSHHHNHKAVVVGELEYAFHYALKNCFGKSLERDPTNVDYHCWYLAVLAGSLLLCSGNHIGPSGGGNNTISNDNCAHPYPSYCDPSTVDQSQSLFDDDLPSLSRRNNGRLRPDAALSSSSTSPPAHEIRRRLPKFCELRKETAEVFHLLLRLSSCYDHNQGSSTNRCHRAIASFLEWKQVIALLVGGNGGDNDSASSSKKRKKKKRKKEQVVNSTYRDICRLHADHMYRWALSENTATSQSYLKQAVKDDSNSSRDSADCNDQKKNQILNAYACALEDDPSSKMNWLLLISELGPLGTKSEATMPRPPSDQEELEQKDIELCQECSDRLVAGYHCSNIHHNDKAISSYGEDNLWWGSSRKDWWNGNLLRIPNTATTTTTTAMAADEEELLQLLSTTVADVLEGELAASTTLDEDVQEAEGSGSLDGAVPSSTTASGEQAPSSNNNNDNGISLQWLDDVMSTALQHDNNEKPPSYRARKQSVDHKLPCTFQEVLGAASTSSSLEDQDDEEEDYQQQMSLSISSSAKQQFLFPTTTASGGSSDYTNYTEMLCYKLLIRSHLYGLLDDHVENGIKQLAIKCYSKHSKDQIQSDSVAFVALQYLYRMHINVPQILHDLMANAATTRK